MTCTSPAFIKEGRSPGDYATRIESPEFIAQATKIGVSDKEELTQLASDLRTYQSGGETEDRTHVTLMSWIEVLATKPSN